MRAATGDEVGIAQLGASVGEPVRWLQLSGRTTDSGWAHLDFGDVGAERAGGGVP